MEPYFWLFAFALLLLAEAATMGLATIWFAGGSLAAFAVNLLGGNQWFQVGTFLAVSFVLLVFTRPLAVRYINQNREKTNVDGLICKTAVATEDIDNIQAKGRVQVNGLSWAARTEGGDTVIRKGEIVEVLSIEGVKLIVKKQKKEDET